MKFIDNIIKLAHIAPHHRIVNIDNQHGYWIQHGLNNNHLFISSKDGKVWIPLALRGQLPHELTLEILKSLDDENNGNHDYNNWLDKEKSEKEANKIFDGYGFTDQGKKLLERFGNFLNKNNLDKSMIDKIIDSNNVDDIKNNAKTLAKKYRQYIESLKHNNDPNVERINKEFYNNWNKLNPLFQYNPEEHNPKIKNNEDKKEENLQSYFNDVKKVIDVNFDPQMSSIEEVLRVLNQCIANDKLDLAKKAFALLQDELIYNVTNHFAHSVGQKSAEILQSQPYKTLHNKLFHGIDNNE